MPTGPPPRRSAPIGGSIRSEDVEQRRLAFRPPTRSAQRRPVHQAALRVHDPGSSTCELGQIVVDDTGPLLGTSHIAGSLTRRQQGAVGLACGRRAAHLAGRQRGHRLVKPGETLRHPPPHHEPVAAVGERSHLQFRVTELVRQLQREARRLLQPLDVVGLARHDRQLDVALLDASALGRKQPASTRHPTPDRPPGSRTPTSANRQAMRPPALRPAARPRSSTPETPVPTLVGHPLDRPRRTASRPAAPGPTGPDVRPPPRANA